MIINTRKHVWPAALVMSLAIVGVLAAFLVLAATPGSSSAHGGTPHDCSGLGGTNQGLHDAFANPGDDLCADSSAEPLDMPANLMADDQTVTSITISWDAVTGASGYRVEYKAPSDTAYQVYAIALQATSATISGLDPGTLYSIKVTALGVTDVSEASEAALLQANTDPVAYDLNLSTNSPTRCGFDGHHRDWCSYVRYNHPEARRFGSDQRGSGNRPLRVTRPRCPSGLRVRMTLCTWIKTRASLMLTGSSLRGVGPRSIDDGIMDIQIRDAASRVFTLDVTCDADNVATLRGVLDIEIRDDTATEVACGNHPVRAAGRAGGSR